jgi:hypothetical protein
MTCQQAQSSLSMYLYGELDFAQEEALENHLAQCAACQLSLTREKQWHTLTNGQSQEPPLDLLAECRQQLRPALAREASPDPARLRTWWRWSLPFEISTTRWTSQVALASLLVAVGFASARLLDRGSLPLSNINQMGLVNPANMLIRDIRPGDSGQVRIVVDHESEILGGIDDPNIRSLLLLGARQPEPGVRFYAVQFLNQQSATDETGDVRQVLFDAVRSDPNPAVRLQAMDGLRRFSNDPAALETIKFVLQHDDDPGVRYQAIDILVPPDHALAMTPAMLQVMQDVMLSSPEDDYVHARCSHALQEAKVTIVY